MATERRERKRGGVSGLSTRIAQACDVRGIAPTTLGEQIGMRRGHMSKILKDPDCDLHASTLRAISIALNVNCEWLLTQSGPFDRVITMAAASGPVDVTSVPPPQTAKRPKARRG